MICATYIINKISLSLFNLKSPYELKFGKKSNIKYFKVFGFVCYVHISNSKEK